MRLNLYSLDEYMATVDLNAKYTAPDAWSNDSKKTMVYIADNGDEFFTTISENIGESFGFSDYTSGSTAQAMPNYFKMRTISFSDASGNVKGTYPVGNPDEDIYGEGGQIIVPRKGKSAGVVCTVLGAQGEKRRFAQADDTSQQSGDNT